MLACFSPSASRMLACLRPWALLMAACCSPSDFKMAARLCCSASFCSDIAWSTLAGGVMSRISIRLSRTPHLRVASAMWSCILELMVSRSDRDSSSVSSPNTARSAVRAIWSMASPKSFTSNSASFTSVTWQKMVALTHSETLSLVITACWSPVRGNSRMSTLSIRSARGTRTWSPGWWMALNSPNRFTTPTQPCWTTLRLDLRNTTMSEKIATPTTTSAIDVPADAMIMVTTSWTPL